MSNTAPSRADPVVVFPLGRWCPPQETSQPHPPLFWVWAHPMGWCYIVMASLNGWAHTQNDPWIQFEKKLSIDKYFTTINIKENHLANQMKTGTSPCRFICMNWLRFTSITQVISLRNSHLTLVLLNLFHEISNFFCTLYHIWTLEWHR